MGALSGLRRCLHTIAQAQGDISSYYTEKLLLVPHGKVLSGIHEAFLSKLSAYKLELRTGKPLQTQPRNQLARPGNSAVAESRPSINFCQKSNVF